MASRVDTSFLILSDTHGDQLIHPVTTNVDVAIHCGDLTEESKLEEYQVAIKMLRGIDAPLKLVIAGNHDFSLDENVFETHLSEIRDKINDDQLLDTTYGKVGSARSLFESEDAKSAGIIFLDEGTHHFNLQNGAQLTVYASPYTASKSKGWGFQYNPDEQDHEWNIEKGVDLVLTHSPPQGVLDYTDSRTRAGIPSLFGAVAQAKPRVHCFGHIHEAWGAKLVTWRDELSEPPSHFTDIDNEKSQLIDSRAKLSRGKFDTQDVIEEKENRRRDYQRQGYREINDVAICESEQTVFVNAAIEGAEGGQQQLPWIVNIQLPKQASSVKKSGKKRENSSGIVDETDTERKRLKSTG
ncbi:unnamed protein product [Periconia digitata]|uniref:Calcineurin-like phosphoesterase domain-containing protein n=1 Tax=Periconia digitata TaxID=1303443 RepID=A0A9W4U5V2_9PLEO|nr:unnamed protein product [Periconia digitata]